MVFARLLLLSLFGLIFLAGCTPTGEPIEILVTPTGMELPLETEYLALSPPTTTTQAEPTGTSSSVGTPDKVEKESLPTPFPCDGSLTSPNQEGPFYSPGSPEKSNLIEEGMPGIPILISGQVFDQDCNPIPGARLDFWLADVNGEYDNVGYTLRGHLFSDEYGYYVLESIEPTPYTGRPPHIHVKVFAPDGNELLTTQLYFTGSEGSSDVTTSPDLLVEYLGLDEDGRKQATFNFIVRY
jgi:protocatechuate 3,4-dioxygenase beta subunit